MKIYYLLVISTLFVTSWAQTCPSSFGFTNFGSGCTYCYGYNYIYQNRCVSSCPSGTVANANKQCVQNTQSNPCSSIPNSYFDGTYCQCNPGFTVSGRSCVQMNSCTNIPNSSWNGTTCACNSGYVNQSNACVQSSSNNPCNFIPNSYFNGSFCVCNSGYTQQGTSCVQNSITNPCSFISGATFNGYSCVCAQGYIQSGNACIQNTSGNTVPNINNQYVPNPSGSGPPITCPQGTFLSGRNCTNCPQGCSVCTSSTQCTACSTGFRVGNGRCTEICGKGFRIYLQCDDGNAASGDGCSSNCTTEVGWTCSGGGPNNPDHCTYLTPAAVTLINTGTVHTFSHILANIRLNYLPTNLSALNCSKCTDLLLVNLTTKPFTTPTITTRYIPGSSYTFSIDFAFPGEPISTFSATVQLRPQLAQTYFSGVDISQTLTLNIDPSVMAIQDKPDELTLP